MTTASDLINMQIAVKDTKNTIREHLGMDWVVCIHLDDCSSGESFGVSVFTLDQHSDPIKAIKFLIRDDDFEVVAADEIYTSADIDNAATAIANALRITHNEVA